VTGPAAAIPALADPPTLRTIKSRAVEGAGWTIVGYGAQQVLRFGSNLILTRLLVPDAFGLMALTTIFVLGLELLSDVGVGPAIIQSKRGDDPALLDTAWTVQIIRGFALFAVSLVIAWPASRLYAEPRLTSLIAAAGAGIAIRGFTPTRIHTLNRKVLLRRVTVVELLGQGLGVVVTVTAAWFLRSVWALIIGTIVGDVARVSLSYLLLPGHRHRLHIDRESVHEIVRVGRWVLASTALTFGVGQLDRLTMGRLLSIRELGIYSIAFLIVNAIVNGGRTVGSRVLFPILAETIREAPERLYGRLPTTVALVVLAVWGDWLIKLLYPIKYQEAGWMLRVLAAGSIPAVVNQASGVLWPSLGEFRIITVLMVLQLPLLFAAMLLGHAMYGVVGFVVGVASVELLFYPVQALLIARRKLWQPELDVPVVLLSGVIIALGAFLR
jgi:O-antigen/teichoic acid export membrane protein